MNRRFTTITFYLCIITCLSDIVFTTVAGLSYPGYSHLHDTISKMGALISPISKLMSTWWTIIGFAFIIIGLFFQKSFNESSRYTKLILWLFVGYGVGEGICSGIFPVNYSNNDLDFVSTLHIGLSGLGVLSFFIIPIVLQKIFTKKKFPVYNGYSYLVLILGLGFIVLFTLSKSIDDTQNFFVIYKGLWQRLLTLNFYAYLITTVIIMYKQRNVDHF